MALTPEQKETRRKAKQAAEAQIAADVVTLAEKIAQQRSEHLFQCFACGGKMRASIGGCPYCSAPPGWIRRLPQ